MNVWVEFIKARLGEDEEVAQEASKVGGPNWPTGQDDRVGPSLAHARRHDPARVLREVEAHRALVKEFEESERLLDETPFPDSWNVGRQEGLEIALRLLASTWADHEDYPGLCRARATFWPDVEACEAVCSLPAHASGPHKDETLGEWSDDELPTTYPDE